MTVKVYVDWYGNEIINESEHKERIRQESERRMADENAFHEWLEENYTPQAIWTLTEAGRIELLGHWEQICKENAEEDSDFELREIDI